MKKFDTRVYSVSDFTEWQSSGQLELSPAFQRRPVWSEKAKSYIMNTIIKGKPMPKILMTQDLKKSKTVRILIDGQQRIRAILDFVNDGFKISKTHNDDYGGKLFGELPEAVKRDFYKYEIGTDILFDLDYPETLDIFARLNTYSVRLNKQELFNAEYLGQFKQAAYKMGYKYVTYWKESKILSDQQIARMGEAEFASDLLVMFIDGIQSNKQIEKYYKQFENEDKDKIVANSESKFDKTMSIIGEMYRPEDIANTNFRRIQLFYSLFGSVAHSLFGLKNLKADSKIPNVKNNVKKIRVLLDDLSSKYDSVNKSKDIEELVDAARRGTTDIGKRIRRSEIISKFIAKGL
jgi:hypothetical protein